jgi:hypothetical protein
MAKDAAYQSFKIPEMAISIFKLPVSFDTIASKADRGMTGKYIDQNSLADARRSMASNSNRIASVSFFIA